MFTHNNEVNYVYMCIQVATYFMYVMYVCGTSKSHATITTISCALKYDSIRRVLPLKKSVYACVCVCVYVKEKSYGAHTDISLIAIPGRGMLIALNLEDENANATLHGMFVGR